MVKGGFKAPPAGRLMPKSPPLKAKAKSLTLAKDWSESKHQIEHEGRSMQQNEAGSEAVAMAGPDDDPHPWEVDCRHLFRVRASRRHL